MKDLRQAVGTESAEVGSRLERDATTSERSPVTLPAGVRIRLRTVTSANSVADHDESAEAIAPASAANALHDAAASPSERPVSTAGPAAPNGES
jgi:hypothetical protein